VITNRGGDDGRRGNGSGRSAESRDTVQMRVRNVTCAGKQQNGVTGFADGEMRVDMG
jgi:hypothetical protein